MPSNIILSKDWKYFMGRAVHPATISVMHSAIEDFYRIRVQYGDAHLDLPVSIYDSLDEVRGQLAAMAAVVVPPAARETTAYPAFNSSCIWP